jgi:hypothetical protein
MEHTHIGASIFGLLALLFVGTLVLALFVFWIWMLVHAITNPGLRDVEKLIWVLVILFTHALGAIIYFFIGRPKKFTSGPPRTV